MLSVNESIGGDTCPPGILASRQGGKLQRQHILVRSDAETLPGIDLFPIVESLVPVKFSLAGQERGERVGEIILNAATESEAIGGNPSLFTLEVPKSGGQIRDRKLIDIRVHFADDPNVPFPFRGRSLQGKVAVEPKVLSLRSDEMTLAVSDSGPVWSLFLQGQIKHFRSAFALPTVASDGNLHEVLNGERFLEMLPMLHFLHEVCGSSMLKGPPLRACFMFDDPNLHWHHYGFVDFQEIAARASKENYHVSFATIPLDTWFTHKPTAKLFRNNSDYLSLLIHGNNHTGMELARDYTPEARVALLEQAIHRVERFERNSGIRVARVMAAPHGACSEEMLEALPLSGFEAATISHGSLRSHNLKKTWTKTLGYLPSELVEGCPVLPRWRLSSCATNIILLAAYLRQPIILVGHHRDLRDGIEVLDQLAGKINGLGSVRWGNISSVCHANYRWRVDRNVMWVRPLGRKILLEVPEAVSCLVIEDFADHISQNWRVSCGGGMVFNVPSGESFSMPAGADAVVSIEIARKARPRGNQSARLAPSALIRRLLTEARDRFIGSV